MISTQYIENKINEIKTNLLQVSDSFNISEETLWNMLDEYPIITYLDIINYIKQHDNISLSQAQGIQLLHVIGGFELYKHTLNSFKGASNDD